MQIENHKEEVPFAHYKDLFRQADPQDEINSPQRIRQRPIIMVIA